MIGRLDRYVLRVFITSMAAAILFAAGLLVLTDQLGNFDNMLEAPQKLRKDGAPELARLVPLMALRYYAYEIPIRFFQFAPLVTFFAAVFTAARLHRTSETTAILAGGRSLHRGFAVLFGAGAVMAVVQLGFRESLLPSMAHAQILLRTRLIEGKARPEIESLKVIGARGERYRFRRYRDFELAGDGLDVHLREGNRLIQITADAARLLPSGRWKLVGGRMVTSLSDSPAPQPATLLEELPPEFALTEADCELAARHAKDPTYLSFSELDRLARRTPGDAKLRVLLHGSLTAALAHLLLPLLGLPCVLRLGKRSTVDGVVAAFALCVFFYASIFLCQELGAQGVLGTAFAAWLPIVLFGSLGIALFESMST